MEIRGLCSMVFSMCLQSSQLTRLISLRHKPRAYNFCALEPNIPFWRVTYYPPIRKNLSFQILVSEAGCGSGHRELSGFITLIFIGWSSNKCSSWVSRRSSDAKRAAKRSEPRGERGEGDKSLSLSPFSSRLASRRWNACIQVVAHSPEPGAHDKSARQASRRVTRARVLSKLRAVHSLLSHSLLISYDHSYDLYHMLKLHITLFTVENVLILYLSSLRRAFQQHIDTNRNSNKRSILQYHFLSS